MNWKLLIVLAVVVFIAVLYFIGNWILALIAAIVVVLILIFLFHESSPTERYTRHIYYTLKK